MTPETNKQQIEVRLDLHPELPPLEADPLLLYRALLNILVNSVQAMEGGGILTVATAPAPDGGVVISIRDTGIGMSPQKRQHIFTPFFTDKNRGTGLGLAIARNIIEDHHGTIEVESEEGKGSTFLITLKHPG